MCPAQGLGQDGGRAAVPVRSPRHEVWSGEDHREHAQVPGMETREKKRHVQCCQAPVHIRPIDELKSNASQVQIKVYK